MSANTEQRKLAAIMFTDMVGYSALAQRDDKLALELLEEHRELLRKIFPKFNGAEIKTIGDAFLVEFNSALEAAQCAIEIQRALAKRNTDVTADRRIELKIGIHIGDVMHRGGDVYGDGVNIASRIEPLAGAGGICVSTDVERQIRNAVEIRLEKLAPIKLKNISVPMELFRIVLPWEKQSTPGTTRPAISSARPRLWIWPAGAAILLFIVGIGWWWTTLPRNRSPAHADAVSQTIEPAKNIPEKSIAVLPFENLSHDPDNVYFAEGIQDEILTRLSKIADLKVISRTSTQQYQSKPGNLSEIAKQVGVANILEGSVQKARDQVRVNVQLINAATDAHLWAESFDRQLTDIFRIESEIANTIAETLQAKLTGSEKVAVSARPTENPEAYQLYLKGRFFWNKRTAVDLRKSIEYFNQAIEQDPNYALAYAALAQAWLLLPAYDGGAPKDCFPHAETAAKKALALDDNSSDAHAALGMVKQIYDFDLPGAIAEFERAIQLNPNDAMAHHWLSNHSLAAAGQTERAIAEMKRALELDPLSLIINANLGQAYINANRYDDAIAQLRKTIEMEGSFYFAHQMLGEALDLKGRIPEAITEYEKAIALNDDPIPKALLGHLYGRIGRKDEARKILEELRQTREQRYIEAYGLAIVYLGLGDRNETFNWLEQGYRDRDGYYMAVIRIDPVLASLHGDPRFEALAEKIVPASQFGAKTISK